MTARSCDTSRRTDSGCAPCASRESRNVASRRSESGSGRRGAAVGSEEPVSGLKSVSWDTLPPLGVLIVRGWRCPSIQLLADRRAARLDVVIVQPFEPLPATCLGHDVAR